MTKPIGTLLTALSIGRRRRTLSVLVNHDGPIRETDLAARVAAGELGESPADVSDEKRRDVLSDLHHVHLPSLAAGDLVVRDRDAGTAAATAHPLFEREPAATALADPDGVTAAAERAFEPLSDPRRRTVASLLRESGRTYSVRELGAAVADRRPDESTTRGDVRVSLHHVDLPKLDAAGIVDYDADSATVAFRDDLEVDLGWLEETTRSCGTACGSGGGEASQTPT